MRQLTLVFALLLPAALLLTARVRHAEAQPPSFDKLSDAGRAAMQKRFEKEIWPMISQEGKDGCLGCHAGKGQVTALRMTGDVAKDFPMFVKEGFFLPDDAGSLLGRLSDKDPTRRMPKNRPAWTADQLQRLSTFVADLDKLQKK
jgi:hypothetical protein